MPDHIIFPSCNLFCSYFSENFHVGEKLISTSEELHLSYPLLTFWLPTVLSKLELRKSHLPNSLVMTGYSSFINVIYIEEFWISKRDCRSHSFYILAVPSLAPWWGRICLWKLHTSTSFLNLRICWRLFQICPWQVICLIFCMCCLSADIKFDDLVKEYVFYLCAIW